MPTASSPTLATPKTCKLVAQNANQSQLAVHTVQQQPQQRRQQQQQQQQRSGDQDKMDTESNKSEISDVSATPTMKTMKSMMTTVSVLTKAITDMQGMLKASDEDKKAADVERISREKTAKRERINSRSGNWW